MSKNELWESLFTEYYDEVVKRIKLKYPRLEKAVQVEDVVSDSFHNLMNRMGRTDLPPVEEPLNYLCICAVNKARQSLKSCNASQFEEAIDKPSFDHEKRIRQAYALREIYRDFTRQSESEGQVGLRRKELIERLVTLSWEKDGHRSTTESESGYRETPVRYLVLSMAKSGWYDIDYEKACETYQSDRKWAGKKIQTIMIRRDVHKTILATLWDRLPDSECPTPVREGRETFPEDVADSQVDDGIISEAALDLESVRCIEELLRWVAFYTTAFCPTVERLGWFQEWAQSASDFRNQTCPTSIRDLRYHLIERRCSFCKSKSESNDALLP